MVRKQESDIILHPAAGQRLLRWFAQFNLRFTHRTPTKNVVYYPQDLVLQHSCHTKSCGDGHDLKATEGELL
jgi:hypothetical protein